MLITAPFRTILLSLVAIVFFSAPSISAAPALVGSIDPSPGPEPNGAEIVLYDPVTDHLFGFGASPTTGEGQRIVAIDAATRKVVASYQVPDQYTVDLALDSAAGKLYVSDYAGKIIALGTADLAQLNVISLQSGGLMHMAIHTGTKKAYVEDYTGAVYEVDLTTGAKADVASPAIDRGPIAVNSAKNRLYYPYEGYVNGNHHKDIWVVDTATRTLLTMVALPPNLQFSHVSVSASGDRFFVVGEDFVNGASTGRLLVFDATTNAQIGAPVDLGSDLEWSCPDAALNAVFVGGTAIANGQAESHVWKVSLADNQVTDLGHFDELTYSDNKFAYASAHHTIHATAGFWPQVRTFDVNTLEAGLYNIAYRPYAVAVDPARDRLYISDSQAGELVVAKGTTRAVLARIYVGGRGGTRPPCSVAVNSSTNRAYTISVDTISAGLYDTYVAVIDTTTNQLVTRIPLLANSYAADNVPIAVSEDSDLVFVTYTDGNSVSHLAVIDGRPTSATKNTVLKTITLPGSVWALAFNPKNKRLYMARPSEPSSNFNVLDTTNILTANPTVSEFPGGYQQPGAVAINPVTNRVYVSDNYTLDVYIFDAATNAKLGSFEVNTTQNPYPDGVFGVAVDSTTNKIYVTDHGNPFQGTLTVINGATNAITTLSLEVGRSPYHVAVNETTHQIYVANRDGGDVAVLDDSPPPIISTGTFPFKGGALAVTGAHGSYTFKVVGQGGVLSSTLPTGQTISPSGIISGIAEPGTYTVTIRVTEDANPARFAEKTFSFTVPGKQNPLTISVDQRDGSELKQGGIVKLQWTITNSSTTEKAPNVRFSIDPPPGFALQDFGETPIFVDPVSGQATGAPIDPVTKKQVTIPGSRFNPALRRTSFGYPAVTFGLGTMLPGQTLKVRANFRIAYDWPADVDLPFNHAIAGVGTKVGQYVDEQMPLETITVAAADPDDPRPELTVDMTQAGAAWDLDRPAVASVSRIGVGIAGAVPVRKTNEILYRATYRNLGARTARSLQLRVPIPRNTKLKAGSASVDGVKLKDPDIERQYDLDGKLDQEVLIFPTLPDLTAYPAEGNAKTVSFIVRLGTVAEGDEITQNGVLLYTPELLRLTYVEKPLVAKIARPANMIASRPWASGPLDFGPYADPNKPTLTSVQIRYLNAGGLPGTGVTAKFTVPPGAKYVDSFVLNNKGTVLGASERELAVLRAQFPKQAAKYKRIEFDGASQVNFNIGTVGPNTFGYVRVLLQADPATRANAGAGSDPNRSLGKFTASDTKGQFLPAPPTAASLRARGPVTRDAAADAAATGDVNLRHQGGNLGSVFVIVSAPSFAVSGSEVTYRVTWGNLSDTATDPGRMEIPIPAGAEYVDNSMTNPELFANTAGPTDNVQIFNRDLETQKVIRLSWSQNDLSPHSLKTGTFKLKITAEPGQSVRLTGAQMVAANASSCLNTPHVLQVLGSGAVSLDDRRSLFANQFGPGAYAAFGSSKRPSNGLIAGVAAIDINQISVRVANAEFIQYPAEGVILVPLGGLNRVFAIGSANLTTQGSFSGLSTGSGNHKLIAGANDTVRIDINNSGGAFVTGASSLTTLPEALRDGLVNIAPSPFCHNLVGNDGASLVGNDGSTLVGNDGSTLVGLDGATLVGNDGSTLVARFAFDGKTNFIQRLDAGGHLTGAPIELLRAATALVAAGGGNIVTAGGGKVLATGPRGNLIGLIGTPLVGNDGGSLVGLDGSTVIARDGASVIARDGAGLVGNDGASLKGLAKGQPLIGIDGSTVVARDGASLIGNDGSTMSFLGAGQDVSAGAGLVTDNGAGIIGDNGGG